ncbi:MAG TPA: nucleotidyltransferase family protein [Solirubrobacteraceae bacterium]|nr:nucleotidyltransferase family protein [Solirubrobacteraceae bacterium]
MTLSPEYALLLDAIAPFDVARTNPRGWNSDRWGRTLRVADWHRLSPMLFCHLARGRDAPAPVRSALERAYLASSARSLFISDAQRRVVDALVAADIPALLLKGAALVETVYPDPGQREMLDLDILVPSGQIAQASSALAPLGYRPSPTDEYTPSSPSTQLEPDAHHAPALVGREQLVAVELHHHLTIPGEGVRFDIDQIWERGRPSPRGPHLLPSPEDLLLHVSLHFTRNRVGGSYRRRHTGGALAQICDIARIVEHEELNWEGLASSARSYGLETRVFLALFAARELGVPVPAAALAELQPPRFNREVGRRLVTLRVLRTDDHLPVRSLRWMFAPSREVLSRGWNADPTAPSSLARAYMRRARAQAPLARSALRQPGLFIQDRRLNGQIRSLEDRV